MVIGLSLPLAFSVTTAHSDELLEKPTIVWVRHDFPPLTFLQGPNKGQGISDKALAELFTRMPQYNHKPIIAEMKRGFRFLKNNTNYCMANLRKTKERLKVSWMTGPLTTVSKMGLVLKTKNLFKFKKHLDSRTNEVDLMSLALDKEILGAKTKDRSYAPEVNEAWPPENKYKNLYLAPKTKHLFNLLHNNRVDYVFSFDFEMTRHFKEENETDSFIILDHISDDSPLLIQGYIACSKTAEGKKLSKILTLPVGKTASLYSNVI